MKHGKGIDLLRSSTGYTVGEGGARGSGASDHNYQIQVWSDEPESGGELLETISKATEFTVSVAGYQAAIRARPGKVLVHLNGGHRMSCERAPGPTSPSYARPTGRRCRPK